MLPFVIQEASEKEYSVLKRSDFRNKIQDVKTEQVLKKENIMEEGKQQMGKFIHRSRICSLLTRLSKNRPSSLFRVFFPFYCMKWISQFLFHSFYHVFSILCMDICTYVMCSFLSFLFLVFYSSGFEPCPT